MRGGEMKSEWVWESVPANLDPDDMGDDTDAGNRRRRGVPFSYANKDGDGGGSTFSSGDLNSGGRLAPQQGMFRKPRRSRNVNNSEFLNVAMEEGGNTSISVPLTFVPTTPRKKPENPTGNSDVGGPLFPHYTPGAGSSVHKDGMGQVTGGGSGDGDSFASSFMAHTFTVGRLQDGLFQEDPSFKRVNPYEALFLKGVRVGWRAETKRDARVALAKRAVEVEEQADRVVSSLVGSRIEMRKD